MQIQVRALVLVNLYVLQDSTFGLPYLRLLPLPK